MSVVGGPVDGEDAVLGGDHVFVLEVDHLGGVLDDGAGVGREEVLDGVGGLGRSELGGGVHPEILIGSLRIFPQENFKGK